MVDRVLRGWNGARHGFWISKPGVDVKTANIMQMAFSSDAITPRLVAKGMIAVGPAYADSSYTGVAGVPGGAQSIGSVYYGRVISPLPIVVAIASAGNWTLPLINNAGQLGYLQGQWHTYVMEKHWGNPSVVDKIYGMNIQMGSGSNAVPYDWCSARFTPQILNNRVDFITNCRSTVYIKYLVLEA